MYQVLQKANRKAIILEDLEGYVLEQYENDDTKIIRLFNRYPIEQIYKIAQRWVDNVP